MKRWMVTAAFLAAASGCASRLSQEEALAEMRLRQLENDELAAMQAQYDALNANRTWDLCARWKFSGKLTEDERAYGDRYCPEFYPRHAELINQAFRRRQEAEARIDARRLGDAQARAASDAAARRRAAAAAAAGLQSAGAALQNQPRPIHCTRDIITVTPGSMTCQ